MTPEEHAACDAYWYGRNENPYEGGTENAVQYEDAYQEEVKRCGLKEI